ncbi:MAG TPA: hypothetical protein VN372_02280 [Methanospirillum sp.]|nr:hypothetical protein [Methanospirillum sp.]
MILSAVILFLIGILLLTFSKKESIDSRFVSLLPVQSMINLCRVSADLGIMGSAWLLPGDLCGHLKVMQFMPVTTYQGEKLEGDSFVSGPGGIGILVPPAGETLFDILIQNHRLIIPEDREGLNILIQECVADTLEIAEKTVVSWTDDSMTIRINGYCLTDGCQRVAVESPACCTMNPCAICSLLGIFLVSMLKQPVMVERCRAEKDRDQVVVRFLFPQISNQK